MQGVSTRAWDTLCEDACLLFCAGGKGAAIPCSARATGPTPRGRTACLCPRTCARMRRPTFRRRGGSRCTAARSGSSRRSPGLLGPVGELHKASISVWNEGNARGALTRRARSRQPHAQHLHWHDPVAHPAVDIRQVGHSEGVANNPAAGRRGSGRHGGGFVLVGM